MDAIAATFKIVVLGEGKYLYNQNQFYIHIGRVGKTSLTVRFCQNSFDDKR